MVISHGFELLEERDIPEVNTHARLWRHAKTGAQLLSLENDDENKVFGITFRTPPADSTGIAHIMEHAVLCGSRKYPVKEPFVELMKGSLNTFLNAVTFPDKTCYPVASQNLKDFYNLIDVYFDAVFYPLISLYTLQQEGWHYELADPQAPLSYKGVVFNEMKGAYSSPENLLGEKSQQMLFPDNPYRLDSGGNPEKIPDLTYAQFKAFHNSYYHPSNSRIYFYGDDDPQERLRLTDDYLKDFDRIEVNSNIPLQPHFKEPRRFVIPYDSGAEQEGNKTYLTVNWLLPETGDAQLTLGLSILSSLLIETPASPLRKALVDSGLGEDLVGGGLDVELRQMYFSTGLKGIARTDDAKVEALVIETLTRLVQQGIDPDTIAAALNTVEFRLRENNTGSFPRGLSLMLRCLTSWLYDGDPITRLAFDAPLQAIKERLQSGEPYFENLIKQYYLDNQHRVTVILEPDPELGKRREAAEQARLAAARAAMTPDDLQKVHETTLELKRLQETPNTPEALATIPMLQLSDLEREVRRIPIDISRRDGCPILYHDLFTNGILYLDVGFNLHVLSKEELPYVPLFGKALLEMGTTSEDYVRLSQRIGRTTGGIRPSWFTNAVRKGDGEVAWLFLRGKSTLAQTQDLLGVLQEILLTVQLDNQERFRQIVLEAKADQEAQLVPSGHRMINRRLRAHFNVADWATEQMDGISTVFFLRRLLEQVDQDWPGVFRILEKIRAQLVNRQNMLVNVTLDGENWLRVQSDVTNFLERLPSNSSQLEQWILPVQPNFEGLTIPAQVNYVGKGADLYRQGYRYDGSLEVVTAHLRNTYLWDKVRVQGGAYGTFCLFDRHSGVFTMLSYRDPNLLATLEVYDRAGEFLQQLQLSDSELTKSIIGVIGEMDSYQLPDAKGYTSMLRFLIGITDEERQQIRDRVLSTSLADFEAFGALLSQVKENGQVVVLGAQESIQAANAEKNGWLETLKVL
jgi:Zn-dependent M16 (insulinase) family peptidase